MAARPLSAMEVPLPGSADLNWVEIYVPFSLSPSSPDHCGPPTRDAAASHILPHPHSYLFWRIHGSRPRTLELFELKPSEDLPSLGLRLAFPDSLCPYAFVLENKKEEDNSGERFVLCAITVSGWNAIKRGQLVTLKFFDCPKLEAMPPIFTTSLCELNIGDDCSPMLYHDSLQFLPLYKSIEIGTDQFRESMLDAHAWHFGSMLGAHDPSIGVIIGGKATELPGGLLHHTALRMLILSCLPHLRSLPEELAQLTDLQQLIIKNCPELSGRCRVGGELWPRIAHIPHIRIDREDIQCLT